METSFVNPALFDVHIELWSQGSWFRIFQQFYKLHFFLTNLFTFYNTPNGQIRFPLFGTSFDNEFGAIGDPLAKKANNSAPAISFSVLETNDFCMEELNKLLIFEEFESIIWVWIWVLLLLLKEKPLHSDLR